jgi:hypothetical protein
MRSSAAAMFSAGVGQAGADKVGENIQSLQTSRFREPHEVSAEVQGRRSLMVTSTLGKSFVLTHFPATARVDFRIAHTLLWTC